MGSQEYKPFVEAIELCEVIFKEANSNSPIKLNLENVSKRGKKLFKCEECGREVVSRYNLKRHQMIHSGHKPHSCDICYKKFREFSDVRKHKRVHFPKGFFCPICNCTDSWPEDSTKCMYCERSDDVSKEEPEVLDLSVKQEIRLSFECTNCDKIFSNMSNLKRHLKRHALIT